MDTYIIWNMRDNQRIKANRIWGPEEEEFCSAEQAGIALRMLRDSMQAIGVFPALIVKRKSECQEFDTAMYEAVRSHHNNAD